MTPIDLRSDTVTRPSPDMRHAMYEAELGDDVLGDDPTVIRLQEMAAERLGKDAALLCPSGTMSNLVALLTHCRPGDEVILGDRAHCYLNEAGGSAALAGVHPRAIPNDDSGRLDPDLVRAAVREDDPHFPRTRLVCLENTHNQCGGAVVVPEDTRAVAQVARRRGLALHLDGARIFNAAVFLRTPVADLAHDVDTVCFCISKGLAAPVGSLLAGPRDFIREARRWRQAAGGGMRQAGVLAAAGIVALDQMVDRLEEDHQNASRLARGLAGVPGVVVDPERVQTNIVFFETPDRPADEVRASLKERGLLVSGRGPRIRMVTHYGITAGEIEEAVSIVANVMQREGAR